VHGTAEARGVVEERDVLELDLTDGGDRPALSVPDVCTVADDGRPDRGQIDRRDRTADVRTVLGELDVDEPDVIGEDRPALVHVRVGADVVAVDVAARQHEPLERDLDDRGRRDVEEPGAAPCVAMRAVDAGGPTRCSGIEVVQSSVPVSGNVPVSSTRHAVQALAAARGPAAASAARRSASGLTAGAPASSLRTQSSPANGDAAIATATMDRGSRTAEVLRMLFPRPAHP